MSGLFHSINAAAFVIRATLFSFAGIVLLVAFILARRSVRRRYFDRLAAAEFHFRQRWNEILSGEISPEEWRNLRGDARAIITVALDHMEAATREDAEKVVDFLRQSGLLDQMIADAQSLRGWRRQAALVRLGRTRAPEAVEPLVRALDDRNVRTQLAAVRGLARTASGNSAEAMLERIVAGDLALAATSLLNALISCTRKNPRILLPYLYVAKGQVREVLARVLAEVASVALGDDLLLLACDPLPEVRASVARALARADFGFSFPALAQLAEDEEWFVRLRAITSLGQFREPRASPVLLRGVCDSNRHVRQRAAEALAQDPDPVAVLGEVLRTEDAYALQAMIAEFDRRGDFEKVIETLESDDSPGARAEAQRILSALESGANRLRNLMRLPTARRPARTA